MSKIKLKSLRINERDIPGYGKHNPNEIKSYPEKVAKSLLNENNGRSPGCEVWEEIKPVKKAETTKTEDES